MEKQAWEHCVDYVDLSHNLHGQYGDQRALPFCRPFVLRLGQGGSREHYRIQYDGEGTVDCFAANLAVKDADTSANVLVDIAVPGGQLAPAVGPPGGAGGGARHPGQRWPRLPVDIV